MKYINEGAWCMGVRDEVAAQIKRGISPACIASERGVSIATIHAYIYEMIGRGRLRRSEVLFTVTEAIRNPVIELLKEKPELNAQRIYEQLEGTEKNHHLLNEIETVIQFADARCIYGDMYEEVRVIETRLHKTIQEALVKRYGHGEQGWWRKGIPESIRKTSAARREEDNEPAEPYCYISILDIRKILDENWGIISECFPSGVSGNKKKLMDELIRLNQIRRRVMHPIRASELTEKDFEFLLHLKKSLGFI